MTQAEREELRRQTVACNRTYCMCYVGDRCAHTICPHINPEYRMPHVVAKEIEAYCRQHGIPRTY